jgi:hypothetical protein
VKYYKEILKERNPGFFLLLFFISLVCDLLFYPVSIFIFVMMRYFVNYLFSRTSCCQLSNYGKQRR